MLGISVVIPHADRTNNLHQCLWSLVRQTVSPTEVIVSDYSKNFHVVDNVCSSIYRHMPVTLLHHKKGKFIRGPAINSGRRLVKTPLIFILDADIAVEPDAIATILKTFSDPPKRYLLSFKGKLQHQNKKESSIWHPSLKKIFGGFMVLRTADYDMVGGHNPYMSGWGWQDEDFRDRLYKVGVRPKIVDKFYTHLWHQPSNNVKTQTKNRKIANQYFWDGKAWRKK